MSELLSTPAGHGTSRGVRTGCVEFATLYRDPLLEEPPSASAPAEQRREYAALLAQAAVLCGSCPLAEQCLYVAVVHHDVAGYVAGTTQRQRLEMRRLLGIAVTPEDFDTLAGVTRRHRQVDHDEVVRLRNANPHESLETLAQRLGCSLSTVKRHLRHDRQSGPVQKLVTPELPARADVMAAFAQVTGTRRRSAGGTQVAA